MKDYGKIKNDAKKLRDDIKAKKKTKAELEDILAQPKSYDLKEHAHTGKVRKDAQKALKRGRYK